MESISPVDKHSDKARLKNLQEFFARKGVRFPGEISPNLLDEFRSTILSGRSPKTVKNYIAILKTALNKAVEWELIESNPIAKVKPPKVVKTFHFYSKMEVEKLVSNAEEPLKTGIIILVNTGMRRSELLHLRWRDVDLKAGSLRVWPYEGFTPKGKRARTIPITSSVKPILIALSKDKGPDDYVFRPFVSEHRLYKRFAELIKELNMKGTLPTSGTRMPHTWRWRGYRYQ